MIETNNPALRPRLANRAQISPAPEPSLYLWQGRLVPGERVLPHDRLAIPHTRACTSRLTTTALLNYHWAHSPELLALPVNKAIAGIASAIVWASSAWYFKRGVKNIGAVVAAMGALQAWAAFWN